MKKIAMITARGGSKRIPRKNIKEFLGKPIIQYSIETALASGVFDEVMVSTDDKEIAEIAKAVGASVPFFRSEATANDFATTADVIEEVLMEYEKMGQSFDLACCIYPTAPFIEKERLVEAMTLLEESQGDTVMPVVQFSFPPQRCVIIQDGKLQPKYPECMPMRSQDLEPQYHDSGQFYCLNVKSFLTQKTVVMKNTYPVILSDLEVQDIDTMEDWKMAEIKYQILHE
ncbi:MAG: pseudaminic acid cytidylyltransferase [Eubacteriales bacterium]